MTFVAHCTGLKGGSISPRLLAPIHFIAPFDYLTNVTLQTWGSRNFQPFVLYLSPPTWQSEATCIRHVTELMKMRLIVTCKNLWAWCRSMRDLRQKEKKKKLPQNKPSRDEPCLPRCNTSSMVGSADPRSMAALTQFICSAMRTFWPRLCCMCFFVIVFFLLKPWKFNKTTMGGRSGHRRDITPGQARLVTARFVLRQLLFSFWRKSLILCSRSIAVSDSRVEC